MSEAFKIEEVAEIAKKKLLIIDDDPNMTKLMEKVLQKVYEVQVIDNASDAFAQCKKAIPDAIILDLNMPNIDGFEFLKMISNDAVLCDIPTIVVTSNKSEDYRDRAHEEGAIGMVYKPFDMLNLSRDVEGYLESTHSYLKSRDNRVNYFVEFSENRKNKKIKDLLLHHDYEKGPLVYLSWTRAEDFLYDLEVLNPLIDDQRLIFLEIKPSLISKFPYIQNITPIVNEIKVFLENKSRNYHLIMEEPKNLLNIHMREKSISQAYNMAQMIHSEFEKITYVNSRPHSEDATKFLLKIGKILTGDLR